MEHGRGQRRAKFLDRVWRMIVDDRAEALRSTRQRAGCRSRTTSRTRVLHRDDQGRHATIWINLAFNTAIARMMEFVNFFTKQATRPRQAMEPFVLLLSPFAPHMAEELWQVLGHDQTLAYEPWPEFDEQCIRENTIEVPVQVGKKVRAKIQVPADATTEQLEAAARADERIAANCCETRKSSKSIVVPGRLVNFKVNIEPRHRELEHGHMNNVISLVLGGGRGSRLYPLTKLRAKPAVPLAAKYRLIDIPLSNCINSGLNRIYVLTQFLSVSLHRHIRRTYRFDHFTGGFVELLAAQQTADAGTDWYQGTADAVRKNLRYVEQPGIDYVLILSGDQLYRMDYREMLETHEESGADVTIAAMPVDREAARPWASCGSTTRAAWSAFWKSRRPTRRSTLVRMDPAWIDAQGIESQRARLPGQHGHLPVQPRLPGRRAAQDRLSGFRQGDLSRRHPQPARAGAPVRRLLGRHRDDPLVLRSELEPGQTRIRPSTWPRPTRPIYSRARFLPPSLMEGARIEKSLIADGCRIGKGAVIENSVIGLRCIIGESVTIRNSILMGADFYEQNDARKPCGPEHPLVGIGDGSVIEGAIVDKNCRIGRNVRVVNEQGIEDGPDDEICMIRDGIPVVVKDAVLPDGWQLS